MSVVRRIDIKCDQCGGAHFHGACDTWVDGPVRSEAHLNGWRPGDEGKDVCPDCVTKNKKEK